MAYRIYVTVSGEDRIARISMNPASGALQRIAVHEAGAVPM